MRIKKFLSRAVTSVSAGMVFFAAASSVQAADIGYQRSTSWTDPIFNKGKVNALVVRLGFDDYPLNDSNPYYRDDTFIGKLFEGTDGGVTAFDNTWDGLDGYLRTSSYGDMSIGVGKIIDVQLDEEIGYFFEDEEIYEDSEALEATEPWCDFFQETLKEKIYSMINVSDYDEDADGEVDSLYIFNCAPKRGVSGIVAGFVTDIKGNNLHGGVNSYMYMSFYDEQTPEEEEALFLTLVHETGHMLFGLDDYYNLEGFSNEFYGPGNIMDQSLADLDGYSKYLIGWLDDENTVSYDPSYDKSGKVNLSASDSETREGKKLAFFDYGGGKIAAEYVSSRNNNRIGEKAGFRFYLIGHDGNISKAYGFDDKDDMPSQVVGEGEEVQDLFGLGLAVYDVKTGDTPSFSFRSGVTAFDDSEILRIDLNKGEEKEGSVILTDPRSESAGTKFILVRDGQKTELIYLNTLQNRIDTETFNTADIYNILKTDMEYITDGGFLDSSGRIIDTSEVYEGGGGYDLDSGEDHFEVYDINDLRIGFKMVNKDSEEVSLIYKYPADDEWLMSKESETDPAHENEAENKAENKDDGPREEIRITEKNNVEQVEKQTQKASDRQTELTTGKEAKKTQSQITDTGTKKESRPENVTPTQVVSARTGDDRDDLLLFTITASASVAFVLGWRIKEIRRQKD